MAATQLDIRELRRRRKQLNLIRVKVNPLPNGDYYLTVDNKRVGETIALLSEAETIRRWLASGLDDLK